MELFMSIIDFPAAHSMDTTWFAVDAEGLVAIFETGEDGPAPEAALAQEVGRYEVAEMLPARSALSDVVVDFEGVARLYDSFQSPLSFARERALVFVEALDALRDDLARGTATPIRSTKYFAALIEPFDDLTLTRLASTGKLVGAYGFYHSIDPRQLAPKVSTFARIKQWFLGGSQSSEQASAPSKEPAVYDPAQCGVFCYDHWDYQEEVAPYFRVRIPAKPISIADLPEELRALAELARFDNVRFADDGVVQPIEHFPCASWGEVENFLTSDLKTRLPYPWKK
jgi:hypothetical protein